MTVLLGGSLTANAVETVTEGFDSFRNSYTTDWQIVLTLPEGWDYSGEASTLVRNTEDFKTETPSVAVEKDNTDTYLITPLLTGDFSFWLRNQTKNYQASVTAYACTFVDGELTLGTVLGTKTLNKSTSSKPSWEQLTFTAPTGTRVALLLSRCMIDDFTYHPFEAFETATLVVSGYASGSSYDFGTVPAGTTVSFMLSNNGRTELAVSSINVTGGYTITAGSNLTAIAPQSSAEVTIATPAQDATGTLTIVSNDANSPYTIQLKSTYKVPVPIMGVDPTTVAFGTVTDDVSQTITVSNSGDAELTVRISSSNADFSVEPERLTVPAGDSRTFTLTYYYHAENYGGHAATITVKPNVGEVVTINASANIKDPNTWSEDFSGNTLPQGWVVIGNGWSFENGEAVGTYSRDGWLVTPKLEVQTGQILTFQARSRQFGTDIIVQYQKDGGEWIQKLKEGRNTQTAYETYTISGLEAGTYQLRFATENVCLDNFEGFQLASSTIEQEKWWVGYSFHYLDNSGQEKVDTDTEQLDVIFDGDNVSFNFPNPINGNAWMVGTKYLGEGPTCYIFPNGQFIGKYSGENIYYCGANGNELINMVFYYDEEAKAFYDFEHILINSSTTAVSYWGYFSDVVVSKEKPDLSAIKDVTSHAGEGRAAVYDLQGRRVLVTDKKGIYIINGKKYIHSR